MARRKKEDSKLLTETELIIMNAIWPMGECTVHEVVDTLDQTHSFAYNTVSTIMRVLEKKSVLQSRKEGRSHFYSPLLKKLDYESIGIDHLVLNVFDKTPSTLVKRLIDNKNLSETELKEIQHLLNQRLEQ
ncbi:MAG: BlaI/MecI/CopY family transcriptional regulator [Bacteriovoracaceae bacterium]|nr:BlaI/MecI/CopY family transcriptional regulator [Bacteriovoracaceae bacterium]